MVAFGEIKKFPKEVPMPKRRAFTLEHPLLWRICREQFGGDFQANTVGFFYSHTIGHSERVAEFISLTEDILSTAVKLERTVFRPTNRPYATWIEPGIFWKNCWIKRSLFTILLRCGEEYDVNNNNYEDALFGEEHIRDTTIAVQRFLFGFTRFTGDNPNNNKIGWHSIFCNQKKENVLKLLVKPDNFLWDKSLLGIGSLWN